MSALNTKHDEELFCDDDGKIYRMLDREPWMELALPWVEEAWTHVIRPKPSGPACYITAVHPAPPPRPCEPDCYVTDAYTAHCEVIGSFPSIPDFDANDADYVVQTEEVGVRNQPWRKTKYNQ